MKKTIYFSFLLCILSALPINAQPVMSYDFESKIGTFQEITGGTVVFSGVSSNLGNTAYDGQVTEGIKALATTTGIPIGFNFTFNDLPMNKFIINSCGALILGKDNIKINPDRSAFLLSGDNSDIGEGKQNIIGIGVNSPLTGVATTEISYKLTGTSPNKVLTVQFKDLQLETDVWGTVTQVSLQIRLYETSNKIEMIFKNWVSTSTATKVARVGLKGNDGDAHLRRPLNEDWNNTEKAMGNGNYGWAASSFPVNGLNYTFTLPATCEKPNGQPSELKLTSSSISLSGSFKETATADHYLVVMSEQQTLSAAPINKTIYKAGDKIGNGTVIAYDVTTTFTTPEDLTGSKAYYFHVFAVNSFCSFGPVYNTTSPLIGNIKTLPEMPQTLEIKEVGYDYLTVSATGNAAGNKVIIAITDKTDISEGAPSEKGVFGTPTGMLNIGDKIQGGGTIVYVGTSKNDIKIENLNSNTVYHLMAWSVDSENNYSSTSVTANEITWGKLPYVANFENTPFYEPPFGWEMTGTNFRISSPNPTNLGEEAYQLECNLLSGDPTNGKENTAATQWILLNNSTNRILFNYNITTWTRAGGYKPYVEWDERDVLEILISKNGTDYSLIHTINKENAPKLATASDWATFNVPFDNFKGEKVKIKLRWKTYSALAIKLLVESLTIEEKPACEYPVGLAVDQSTVVGSQASISWTGNEESAWDIRFRKVGDENWGAPIEVRTNPYLITTLPPSSNIELQVRAKCSLTSTSPWSKSLKFNSGYAIPFAENFNSGTTLPVGWSFENGLLDSPTEFCTGSTMTCHKNWLYFQNSIKVRYSTQLSDWAITPQIDMNDGSVHGKLEFDLSMVTINPPYPDDAYFAVVVSQDGGKTFNKENVVLELKKSDIEAINDGKHYSVDLSKFSGIVKLGFYAYSSSKGKGGQMILDNIELKETCPPATNAKASEVTPSTATITWEGNADQWLTFVRKAGETKKEYTKQTEAKLMLTELTPQTNYEVGITKACAVGDTARIVIVAFTTQSLAPCLIPETVTATPNKKSVTISWTAEANSYNIRFREVGSQEWIDKTSQTNSITVDGLESGKEYEYSIQAVCSAAEGDVSPWTEAAKVTTLALTCLPPTDIAVAPTHKTATVSWKGEADNYQLAYRTEGAWILKEVKGSKSYIVNELTAKTNYTLRLRSICAVGDTSEWSANTEFKTAEIPVCSLPTNLRVSGLTDKGVKFEWDADDSNLKWDMHYRPSSATQWTTLQNLTEKSHLATDLTPNTAYLWSVKATCDEGRTSAWTNQETFNTPTGIQNMGGDLKVFASNKVINILNPMNVKIGRVCLYDMNGKALREYTINSDENVMIPTNLDTDKVIVKILGEGFTSSFSLIIR